eukprot:GHVH01005591.1.p2 GENE.GHVH01005591.1~~GHVH01005591.1.p2  ORF type:complete len:143 (+),score=10.49 GHVH01005591.1:101-529(+)
MNHHQSSTTKASSSRVFQINDAITQRRRPAYDYWMEHLPTWMAFSLRRKMGFRLPKMGASVNGEQSNLKRRNLYSPRLSFTSSGKHIANGKGFSSFPPWLHTGDLRAGYYQVRLAANQDPHCLLKDSQIIMRREIQRMVETP